MFETCKPEDVVYRLDFHKGEIDNKGVYIQMFMDCGWEYVDDHFGWSYFRKIAVEGNKEEHIFSESSELD